MKNPKNSKKFMKHDEKHNIDKLIINLIEKLSPSDELLNLIHNSIDRSSIIYILNKFEGNQSKSAKFLGISRNTLNKKINKLGIELHKNNID